MIPTTRWAELHRVTADPQRTDPDSGCGPDNEDMDRFRPGRRIVASLPTIGFSRHTAVPVLRRAMDSAARTTSQRLPALIAGSSLIGVAVAMLVHAELGLPPYDVLTSALSEHLEITLGQASWSVAAVMFLVAGACGRWPSVWGLAYVLLNGVAIDAAIGLLDQPDTIAGRWAFVIGSIVLLASGVSLVVYSGVTGGPFELLMLAGQDRGMSPTLIRYGLDLGVFGLGIILGGSFGLATVVFAISFALAMRITGQALIDHGTGRRSRIERHATKTAALGDAPSLK